MVRILALTLFVLLAPATFGGVEGVATCDRDLLPDGSASCEYRLVPYESISFHNGRLEVRFNESLRATQLMVAEDWFRLQPYLPDKPTYLSFSDKAQRYDLIGRFHDRERGEEFIGVTPIACRQVDGSIALPAPEGGCFAAQRDDSHCRTTARVRCYDKDGNPTGRTVTATCEGDAGSCTDCSKPGAACCAATTTTTTQTPEGVEVERVHLEKKTDRCRLR